MKLRSRYPNYIFRGLRFQNHVAETSDRDLIAAAKSDPNFGQGMEFWEDTAAAPAANGGKTGKGKNGDGGDDNSNGNGGDQSPAETNGGKKNGK